MLIELFKSLQGCMGFAKLYPMPLVALSSLYDAGLELLSGGASLRSTSLARLKAMVCSLAWYAVPPMRGFGKKAGLESISGAYVKSMEGERVWRAATREPNHGSSAACAMPKMRVSSFRFVRHAAKYWP